MNHLLSFLYKISFLWNSYRSTVQKGEHSWGKQEQCIVKLLESTCCIARWNYRLTVSWNVSALSATQFALQSYWAVCGACSFQKIQPLMQWKPIMIPTFSLQDTCDLNIAYSVTLYSVTLLYSTGECTKEADFYWGNPVHRFFRLFQLHQISLKLSYGRMQIQTFIHNISKHHSYKSLNIYIYM